MIVALLIGDLIYIYKKLNAFLYWNMLNELNSMTNGGGEQHFWSSPNLVNEFGWYMLGVLVSTSAL